jgi:glycerophosphoryl diester phosphodiesterase
VRLRATGGDGVLVIAHRGLPGAAAENSLAGLSAALAAGADIVEVDVSDRNGSLVLAHSEDVAGADSPSLAEGLALFAERAPAGAGIQLDVKPRSVDAALVDAVRRHDLVGRTLVSSTFAGVLRRIRAREPRLATALGYPYDRAQVSERRLAPGAVVDAALVAMRLALPHRAVRMARGAEADVLSLHHVVLSAETVRRLRRRGIGVFAWTVNDRQALDRVLALGVDGVVTDEPGLLRS